jgi:hypothetical protein
MKNAIAVLGLLVASLPSTTMAEGLIHQLPADGAWIRFEVVGKAQAADGTVRVSIKGTQTIRSVGRATVDGQPCRWIELDSKMTFERAGAKPSEFTEIFKLLIPEKYLEAGQNPREHVLKAYRGQTVENLKELNLKSSDERSIASLDEIFHAPLEKTTELPAKELVIGKRKWTCKGSQAEATDTAGTFKTETRFSKDAPFGIVTYKYEKQRIRNGASLGSRQMEWKLVESGKAARSAAPDAK